MKAKAKNQKEVQRNRSYLAQEPCVTDAQLAMGNDLAASGMTGVLRAGSTGPEVAGCGTRAEHSHLTCVAAVGEVRGEVRKAHRGGPAVGLSPSVPWDAAQCSLAQCSPLFLLLGGMVQGTSSPVQIGHLGMGQENNL